MPRKIQDKEINDMRRIIEIMMSHPKQAHKRMWEFCIGSVKSRTRHPSNSEPKGSTHNSD